MRKAAIYLAALVLAMSALAPAAANEPGQLVPGDRFKPRPAPTVEPVPVEPTMIAPTPSKPRVPPLPAARPRARPADRPVPRPGEGGVQF